MSVCFCSQSGKVCYTRHAAGLAILAILGKEKRNTHKMFPYRCRFCREWHIGRTDPVAMRRRQERDKRRVG